VCGLDAQISLQHCAAPIGSPERNPCVQSGKRWTGLACQRGPAASCQPRRLRVSLLLMDASRNLLRELPSLDRLLSHSHTEPLLARFRRQHVARECRTVLDELRTAIRAGRTVTSEELTDESIIERLERRLAGNSAPRLERVINATGTVLHTNLGRALLAEQAIDAMCRAGRQPVTVEYDLAAGTRGRRERLVEPLLQDLTGAEAATVVNNNAAAVLLALNTMASGKEVLVSRGELIEIGGSFRLPEIMEKSGAILREVGTTNRTHLGDYERALGPATGLLLKVHTSNYRIVGFTAEVGATDLVALGRAHRVPVMEDLGSGALVDLTRYGLPKEPVVSERVALGVDIVTFSGDKVLGGPQAGLIVGNRTWIDRIAANPLHRALRCGKVTLAALEATLRLYQQSPDVAADLPTLRALARPLDAIDALGRQALPDLQKALGKEYRLSLENSTAQVGSGALPTEDIPSKVIAVGHQDMSAEQVADRFRSARPSIIGRISGNRFLLDLRTVFDPDDLIPRWPREAGA
jgi:L-seryl-tRNA(Ser) seleniumtransferase